MVEFAELPDQLADVVDLFGAPDFEVVEIDKKKILPGVVGQAPTPSGRVCGSARSPIDPRKDAGIHQLQLRADLRPGFHLCQDVAFEVDSGAISISSMPSGIRRKTQRSVT